MVFSLCGRPFRPSAPLGRSRRRVLDIVADIFSRSVDLACVRVLRRPRRTPEVHGFFEGRPDESSFWGETDEDASRAVPVAHVARALRGARHGADAQVALDDLDAVAGLGRALRAPRPPARARGSL